MEFYLKHDMVGITYEIRMLIQKPRMPKNVSENEHEKEWPRMKCDLPRTRPKNRERDIDGPANDGESQRCREKRRKNLMDFANPFYRKVGEPYQPIRKYCKHEKGRFPRYVLRKETSLV
jgi:hypothetical protein